ncbi:hypothetical protein AQJ46_49150 [Streptomyces canus]|uniref:Uncharacterized protein n=1 Tax=Streptomyces canus TaxID=58343 RepID=A0A124HV22_9ACTN|nr:MULTISPECIES: HEAT repeat domain-containing protein [Streptomyces]KUN55584.1 hypothetical protein AQJ46_49150 [Streptomyces canus]MDI5907129.1 HEAT repeat domain-containing protein [Streptomyces sp. 12257]
MGFPLAVRDLLDRGADPDAVDAGGLPVLCGAAPVYDAPVAKALVEGGADADLVLPDGTTPLWGAIDGGSPAVFSAVLGTEPRLRLSQATRERMLALARHWYETGAVEELRRRTSVPGPATTVRVQDDEYDWVDQVSLGDLIVRDGHGAILTSLEWAFRITQRRSLETWSAVVAHLHDRDPAHRRFVVDYLRMWGFLDASPHFEEEESELLAAWSVEETDGEILAKVLDGFTDHDHPGQEAIGLLYCDHPDPRVRREVPYALSAHHAPRTPAARAAVRALMRDPDAEVRLIACTASMRDDDLLSETTRALRLLNEDPDAVPRGVAVAALAGSRDGTPAVADALAELLDDDNQLVRLEAAYGLALRDDPRTAKAIERVGPLGDGLEHHHRASALWQWRWQKENSADE